MADYDIIVLGGGPGGYVAAIKGAQMGQKVCLIEKDKLGGVCLNRGCIPTKTMLKTVEIFNNIKESQLFAVTDIALENIKVDMQKLQKRKAGIVGRLTGGVADLLKANGVDVFACEALFRDKQTIIAGGKEITAKNIIIATGSVPMSLPISISDDAPVICSDEALDLDYLPERVAIIGGGVIGVEFAHIFRRFGADVTIIELLDGILPMFDADITRVVTGALRKSGIKLQTFSQVLSISGNKVVYRSAAGEAELQADIILVATGRKPYTTGFGLEKTGVKTERGAIVTDYEMRTNIPGIYAIGDVNGKSMLAHTAFMEALVAIRNICGEAAEMNYERIPSCVYLHPEIAAIGLSEVEAKKKYARIKVGRFPLAANGKALVEGSTEGLIKVIVAEPYNEIVGVHIYGIHSTDMIGGISIAMQAEAAAEDIAAAIFPHPTVSEIIPEAFHAALGKAIHCL